MQHLGPFTFLLLVWLACQLMCFANPLSKCRYKIKIGHEIDFKRSKELGAKFVTLEGLKVQSAAACTEACCNESSGRCSLGEYNPQPTSVQCLLFQCHPLEACLTTTGSRGIQVAIINRTYIQQATEDATPTSRIWEKNAPDARLTAIEPQKELFNQNNSQGVEQNGQYKKYFNENSTTLNTVTSMSSERLTAVPTMSSINSTLTHDVHIDGQHNSTDRKNIPKYVDNIMHVSSESSHQFTTASSRDSRTSLAYVYVYDLDAEKNKTSVGKKGVINPPEDENKLTALPYVEVTNFPNASSFHELVSNDSTYSNGSHLDITLNNLQQNKTLIPIQTNISNNASKITNLTAIKTEVNTTVIVPVNNASSLRTTLAVVVTTQYISPVTHTTVPDTKDNGQQVSTLNEIPTPQVNSTSLPATVAMSSMTSTLLNDTADNSKYEGNQTDHIMANKEEVDVTNVQAGIHLVIALVIGLLLLLTVVGLVIRRVHDVWQRRHYQRMDFLVDGMYNTVST